MSRYAHLELAPPIEVFNLTALYEQDRNPKKVNLGIGAYRNEEGKPWVFPVVRKVEKKMAEDESLNHEYLPVLGLESCTTAATRLLLGQDSPAIREGRATGVQCLSGTGAVRVAAEFLCRTLKFSMFYASDPTWGNHRRIFRVAGFQEGRAYRYWDDKLRKFNFDGMLEDLKKAPENAVVIFQTAAHNPTGVDPSQEQWKQISDVIKERKLFPFFDCAYQGAASGDFDRDAFSVRLFDREGHEFLVAQSFAKNFGLYDERVGNLVVVAKDRSAIPKVRSQITLLIRAMYSNPPHHGARIVSTILNDPALFEELKQCQRVMAERSFEMRRALRKGLERRGTPGTWHHITAQSGLFSYTCLTEVQCEHLIKDFHIYLLRNGRMNVCGLTAKNVDYVAKCMDVVVRMYPSRLLEGHLKRLTIGYWHDNEDD